MPKSAHCLIWDRTRPASETCIARKFWHDGCVDPEPAFLEEILILPKSVARQVTSASEPHAARWVLSGRLRLSEGVGGRAALRLRFRVLVKFFDKEQKILRYAYLYKYRTRLHEMNPLLTRKLVYPRFGFETLQTMDAREADEATHLSENLYHVTYDGEKFIVALSERPCP